MERLLLGRDRGGLTTFFIIFMISRQTDDAFFNRGVTYACYLGVLTGVRLVVLPLFINIE